MLRALNRLGDVGVRVIKASKDSTIETFRQLDPVLTELADTGDNFVKSFNVFLTYPFVDEVVGRDPQVARNLHMGDYTNLSIELDVPSTATTSGTDVWSRPACRPDRPARPERARDPTVILDDVAKCLEDVPGPRQVCAATPRTHLREASSSASDVTSA